MGQPVTETPPVNNQPLGTHYSGVFIEIDAVRALFLGHRTHRINLYVCIISLHFTARQRSFTPVCLFTGGGPG